MNAKSIGDILSFEERPLICSIHGKQIEKSMFGRWFGCPVCLDISAKESKKLEALKQHEEALKKNLKAACIPDLYQYVDFSFWKPTDPRQPAKLKRIRQYADELLTYKMAKSMVLSGNTGTGKSHLGACVVKYVAGHEKLIRALFSSASELMSRIVDSRDYKLRTESEAEIIDWLGRVPVLLLDDVGAKDDIKGRQDVYFSVIDRRYNAQLPTIITTNLNDEQLKSHIGDRAFDRLTQNCIWIDCVWESYRQITKKFERV